MTVVAIVPARMSSTRLPGKVVTEVAGSPLLGYLLDRLARARSLDGVVVATSDEPSDDPVVALCTLLGVDCHRGPLDDVAARLLQAAERVGADTLVRISGDSPLLDPALVDTAVALVEEGADAATNVFPRRTFPHGQSVEAFRLDAYRTASFDEPGDREHVGPWFYRHADELRIASFEHDVDLHELRLAVDDADDLARFAAVVAAMDRPHWQYGLTELVDLAHACR